MKIFKHRNFMGLIYSMLVAIPFFAIAITSAYVVVNKNAKDSYHGIVQYQQNVQTNKPSDLLEGKTYNITIINNVASSTTNASYRIGFSNFSLVNYLIDEGYTELSTAKFFTIGGAVGYTDHSCFAWYDDNLSYIRRTELPLSTEIVNNLQFVFTELNTSNSAYFTDSYKGLIKISNNIIIYDDSLDNVFYYSVDKVVQNNNFGNINFLEWFASLFLDLTNTNNALFLHFANWYLNYVLFVSCAYLIFLILMWFINFARRLLERGMNYDW